MYNLSNPHKFYFKNYFHVFRNYGGRGDITQTIFNTIQIFSDEEELPLQTKQVVLEKFKLETLVKLFNSVVIKFSFFLFKVKRNFSRASSRRRSTVIHFKQKFRSFKGKKVSGIMWIWCQNLLKTFPKQEPSIFWEQVQNSIEFD